MPDGKITQPLCQRCQHARTFHGNGGRCKALGCSACEAYISPSTAKPKPTGPVGYPYGEAKPEIAVRAGQVWNDNDPRSAGRTIRVDEVVLDVADPYAKCTVLSVASEPQHRSAGSHAAPGKTTQVKIRRFRPTQTGYVLAKDV